MSQTGPKLYERAKRRIPGGTQLLSKRPEMHLPDHWPAYYSRAKGMEVWDLDGRRYVDMSYSGIGSCVLGYADDDVNAAVKAAVDAGSMNTLNCPEEVELADLLCELHPWADMVRYARGGGEALSVAVRIARARTGRDRVAFCGYHGWHDWYLAANLGDGNSLDGHLIPGLAPAGVPRGLSGTAKPFHFNKVDELEAAMGGRRGEFAAIVMEPLRSHDPEPRFLQRVKQAARDAGAVLIFDEVTAGFRLNTGGAHLLYGTNPDIAVFAKAISNGFPMAAVVGTGDVMQAAQGSFISSTYWTERIGPAAAIATIRKHRERRVHEHLIKVGAQIQDGWRAAADSAGLDVTVGGLKPLGHFKFNYPEAQAAKTLFTQLMLEKGYLASTAFYASYAHRQEHVDGYLAATREAFATIAGAIEKKEVERLLKGPVAHAGFYRLS